MLSKCVTQDKNVQASPTSIDWLWPFIESDADDTMPTLDRTQLLVVTHHKAKQQLASYWPLKS